jgi:hypothetical protein
MFHVIESAVVGAENCLTLQYRDGERITVDFKKVIDRGGVFAKLADPMFFRQVAVGPRGRSIEWPGGLDFCADALWFEAHGGMGDLQQVVVETSV